MSGQPPLLKFDDFRSQLENFLKKFGAGGSNANNGLNGNRYNEDDDPYTGRGRGHAVIPTGDAAALHVARRLTFGATPALVAEITSKGIPTWINEQLSPSSIDDSAMDPILACFPGLDLSAAQLKLSPYRGEATSNLAAATMARAVWSKRQLLELMVDFWTNHFNMDATNGTVRPFKPTDDLTVIRVNALSKFSDMLIAATKSPAMLTFLNNAQSRADGNFVPNENHARELMELHTVGIANGYTEADVFKVAHLLSGWTIAKTGEFTFDASKHDLGPAADGAPIVGWSRNGLTGVEAGESFLNHLSRQPSTARRIAFKLCVRFIGDYVSPSDAIVTKVADAFLANDTQIVPTLQELFKSNEFKASAGLKARRPFEFIAGTLRAANVSFDATQIASFKNLVNSRMNALGQPLFGWTFPNGYADADYKWVGSGSMIDRWNFARKVAVDGFTLSMFDIDQVLGSPAPKKVGAVITKIATAVLSEPLDPAVYDYILEATDLDPDMRWQSWYDARPLLAYILQSPQNQIR
ncbi:MAG: DUF1800 family protein [Actinobacteria bacterium]|uniref:Unannotated protein n=1 Tax=freshwater metagenome TaxID=449393 RepID=A0A6J5YG07_9ZZZZ|nr:DUF1800 family protein [Actinomycetota bacterium]